MTPLIVLILIVCAIIGALLGERSGHRINGMFFGLLLGPIGVLIVALWKPRPRLCRGDVQTVSARRRVPAGFPRPPLGQRGAAAGQGSG